MPVQSILRKLPLLALLAVPPAPAAAASHHHRLPAQHGGRVKRAWPTPGATGRPTNPLAGWLAGQVGATKARLHRDSRHRGPVARIAAASVPFQVTGATGTLALVRSYQIPSADPAAPRLTNLSWTFDSAISAVAFSSLGYATEARQLLDQLSALQRADGSIDFAYNTANGQSIPEFRAGTIASAGLAAVAYRAATCTGTYDSLALGAAKWLLAEQVSDAKSAADGLVLGGPDVSWASTQHNLLARAFLARLADEIDGRMHVDNGAGNGTQDNGNGKGNSCPAGLAGLTSPAAATFASTLHAAVTRLDAGIDRALFVRLTPAGNGANATPGTAYFREGAGDDARPVDAQALGALWLLGQNRPVDAKAVLAYADATMLVSGRSVALSANPASFNGTYSANGPFNGYLPYADPSAPQVLWFEGTLEMRLAKAAVGQATGSLDGSIAAWQKITGTSGPLQSDRAVSGNVFNEYHAWPDAAAAAWELLDDPSAFTLLSGS